LISFDLAEDVNDLMYLDHNETLAPPLQAEIPFPQYISTTLVIVMYNLGELCKAYIYADNNDLTEDKGYKANAKTGIADILTMLRLICEKADIDFWEMIVLGHRKYIEKMNGLEKGLKPDQC